MLNDLGNAYVTGGDVRSTIDTAREGVEVKCSSGGGEGMGRVLNDLDDAC